MQKRHLIKLLGLTALAAIGVMAVSVTAAQAKWLLLLNGASVNTGGGPLTALEGLLETENGLKLKCTGGTGSITFSLTEEAKKAVGSASGTLTGCVWEGSEKTCIINDGGVGNIKVSGSGQLTMVGAETYVEATSGASPFTIIKTEGKLCTIPKEEEVTGTLKCHLLEPLIDATAHTCDRETGNLKLGNSVIKKLEGPVHLADENPNATFAFHLVNL